jgi:MFS family permease
VTGLCVTGPRVTLTDNDLALVQRRTLGVLVGGQVLGGLGFGATLSMGSLLFAELSGTSALSGMAATMSTLGAAIAAIPLARIAQARGRRPALMTGATLAGIGAIITVLAPMLSVLPLLFIGIALIGMGNAANLQARFAATDLATPNRRGRDLSLVVWSTTIGAVLGPNLLAPGEALGTTLGLPHLTGPFLLTVSSSCSPSFCTSSHCAQTRSCSRARRWRRAPSLRLSCRRSLRAAGTDLPCWLSLSATRPWSASWQ